MLFHLLNFNEYYFIVLFSLFFGKIYLSIYKNLQSDINALEDWSNTWLLRFHPDKCHVLSLGKFENIQHTERYKICNEEIEHVFEHKDLGIIIDSELSFEEHISNKICVANAIIGMI